MTFHGKFHAGDAVFMRITNALAGKHGAVVLNEGRRVQTRGRLLTAGWRV